MSTKKSKKKNRSSSKTQIQQKSKREYSFKNKLLTTLLLSFVAPLTVCFFGPFETYCGNISEFTFALGDFLPYVAAISVTVAVAVFVLLMILDGRAFDIASAVVFALTVFTVAQKSLPFCPL